MHLRRLLVAAGFALIMLVGMYVIGQSAPSTFTPYDCEYCSAEEMAKILRLLLPKSAETRMVIDREHNRILLSGPEGAHAIARRAFEEIDQPVTPRKPSSKKEQSRSTSPLPEFEDEFPDRLAEDMPALDRGAEFPMSLPVSAKTPRTSAKDEQLSWPFEDISPDRPAATGPVPHASVPASPPAGDESHVFRIVAVRREKFSGLERELKATFADEWVAHRVEGRAISLVRLARLPQAPLEVEFDTFRGGVMIGGPSDAVNQLTLLVQALSQEDRRPGFAIRSLRVRRQNHRDVQKIIHPEQDDPASFQPVDSRGRHRVENQKVSPAAFAQADDGSPMSADQQEPMPTAVDQDDLDKSHLPARQFEGVELKSLPELDVIILRGRDKDLSQLADIIEQLERISEEAQPEVHVHPLQHAQSEAVAELVTQTSKDLISGRSGKVSVTALVKPNAVLIIGWGTAVEAVQKMIEELDQPVAPQTQSASFRLQHASVSDVQKTLTAFFANRKGLGAKVQSTIDARTNTVIVYAAPRDLLEVKRIILELDRPDSAAVHQAKIFPLQHSLAADVAATLQQAIKAATGATEQSSVLELQTFDAEGQRILRSGTLENVRITPSPRNNSLIVSCSSKNLELLSELIRQLDTPAVEAQIKVFEIINGDAASLVQTLRSLLPSQAGAATGVQLPSGADESSLAPLRFSIDARSNSIIATGSEGDLRIVEALLFKLDQSNAVQRKSAVYHLKNAPALDVATAVNQFLLNRRRVEQAGPGQDNPFQDLEREVVVVPEPVGNKLILAATPRVFEEISQLIERLDQQPPQVMIQVLIAEVALNNTDEFGMELGLQDSVLFDRSLLGDLLTTTDTTTTSTAAGVVTATQQVIQSATNIPGFGFNSVQPLGNSGSTKAVQNAGAVGGQGISNFSVGRGNNTLGFGGLVLSASSQNVSVLLRALQESRRVDILSRPQVRTLDNQSAFIQVGQRVPRIIGSQVNQAGQSNQVTLENVGLILAVTPRISPQGNVVMEIDAEKSSLGTEADGIPVAVSTGGTIIRSPRIDTTTAQATVSAADGETIVLGGLITEASNQFHRQVPWLGDIPVLGHLFRYDGVARQRTELLIILTPHVIRSQEDEERLRQVEMAHMSWCAADVIELQGNIILPSTSPLDWLDRGAPETIYPDLNPAGEPQPMPEPDKIEPQSGVVPAEYREEASSSSKVKSNSKSAPSKSKRKAVSRRKPFAARSK